MCRSNHNIHSVYSGSWKRLCYRVKISFDREGQKPSKCQVMALTKSIKANNQPQI